MPAMMDRRRSDGEDISIDGALGTTRCVDRRIPNLTLLESPALAAMPPVPLLI